MADCIYTNPQAKFNDTKWNILQKILCALNASGAGGSSGANLQGNGSPLNVVTPSASGQFYTELDAVPLPKLWQSVGTTSADWRERT